MTFHGKDTRAEERYSFSMTIECAFDSEECDKAKEGPFESVTNDISYSGMAFYSECPADEGQVVQIFLRNICTDPILGEVKWCQQQVHDIYKIGIQYIGFPKLNFRPQS